MWDRRYVCEVQRCLSKRDESELQRSAVVINQLGEKMFLIRNEAPKKKKAAQITGRTGACTQEECSEYQNTSQACVCVSNISFAMSTI